MICPAFLLLACARPSRRLSSPFSFPWLAGFLGLESQFSPAGSSQVQARVASLGCLSFSRSSSRVFLLASCRYRHGHEREDGWGYLGGRMSWPLLAYE